MDYGMPFLLETKSVEDAAALCAQLHLSFMELNMNFPACVLDKLHPKALIAMKEIYGIYITLHLDENFNAFDFNPLVREAYLETMRRTIALALQIKAPIINMHMHKGIFITLPGAREYLFSRYADEYMRSVDKLRTLCECEIGDAPLKIAVENTSGFAAHEKAAVDRLLESKVFGLTLDIGHSHAAGNVDIPYYLARRNKLCHMHAHDAKGTSNHLAFGDGEIDLTGRLALAREAGARVVLETKTIDALKTSVRWLSQSL